MNLLHLIKHMNAVCSIRIRTDLHFEEQEERERQRERVCYLDPWVCVHVCIRQYAHLVVCKCTFVIMLPDGKIHTTFHFRL